MEYKDNSGRNISYGNNYSNGARVDTNVGIPYQDINWYEIKGQPFGIGSRFNVLVFGDANNIVDTKGAMAVGGNFSSPRGLSLAFGNDSKMEGTGYSPYAVRFLVGGNINMNKPLVVVGHVVGGGAFRAGSGSTYLIGKTNSQTQQQQLADLYSASGGSDYWKPSEKGDHFVISSYDTPRFIPAERIRANLPAFFQNARDSITRYKNCISSLPSNGTIVDNYHELILRGNDPNQNIFDIDVRSNGGVFNKGLRPEVPEGSLIIIRFLTGDNAYMQYGVWGDKRLATRTLYVFEDASHIHMKTSSDIWGSILAPQAVFHAHPTGGHVSGNAALGGFDVSANSGFEFHMFPFKGGVNCQMVAPAPAPAPVPAPVPAPAPAPAPAPVPAPAPCPPCPTPEPCPTPIPCPEPEPCPPQKPCPTPEPCPSCPEQAPCPTPEPCPPCPPQKPCPERAPCPPCPEPAPCPQVQESLVIPDVILGYVSCCNCSKHHKFTVSLCLITDDNRILLYSEVVSNLGFFKFRVPYEGNYLLRVRPCNFRRTLRCIPNVTLKNVGVCSLTIDV